MGVTCSWLIIFYVETVEYVSADVYNMNKVQSTMLESKNHLNIKSYSAGSAEVRFSHI